MIKTLINKYGYEVPRATRAKTAWVGINVKVGDKVTPIGNLNGTVKAKPGDIFTINKMWKNKYQTVLEFEGTELTAASILFEKVEG